MSECRLPRRPSGWRPLVLLLLASLPLWAGQVAISVQADHADGIYKAGETVNWAISVAEDGKPAAGQVTCFVRRGGLTQVSSAKLDLVDGQAKLTATFDQPGCLLAQVAYKGADNKTANGLGGAVFDWEKIQPAAPPPADFDAFWEAKLAELAKVPMNAKVEPVDIGDPTVEYFKVTLDNIRGTKIYGQLAKPKGKSNLPAVFTVQWAGVYPLQRGWVVGEAKAGRISLNIMAHDLPFDQPPAFYTELMNGKLKDYPSQGREDRETSYFLRMFLSCYRGADFLASQPEWDGKNMLVQGGSQGGGQSIVAAGLYPKITAIAAEVPALCDHAGQLVGRAAGWPKLCGWQAKPDNEKALQTAQYFDAVNFARRSKATRSLVGVGLIDTTCPPEGCIAMYNQLPGAKQLVIMPQAAHNGPGRAHDGYYQAKVAFLSKLFAGG